MKRKSQRLRKWAVILLVLIVGGILGSGATLLLLLDHDPPDIHHIHIPSGTSEGIDREAIDLGELPDCVLQAIVAIEDERFYDHSGIDIRSVGRAIRENVRAGGRVQGAGTITMQVARNLVLQDRSKTFSRKFREMFVALQLERNYTKEEILAAYLSEIYFGANAYGIEEASRIYFDKDPRDLTLEEAALLAGLPKAPSELSPFKNKEKARERRNLVLRNMRRLNYIRSDEELNRLLELPVELAPSRRRRSSAAGTTHARTPAGMPTLPGEFRHSLS